MQFRPCIDIHNGKVKQIVGGSLRDRGDYAAENFVSEQDAAFYASLYRRDGLEGGHIILLNSPDSDFYEATLAQALSALHAWPGGMQIGGGITDTNATYFLDEGAKAVIVTSYVFENGRIRYDRLEKLKKAIGKEHLVLDISARRSENNYRIVTNRWQTFSDEIVSPALMEKLSSYCSEFLVHGVDSEGKGQGMEEDLIRILAQYNGCPVTYAGGVRSMEDLELLRQIGAGRINVTVGSALDLFGGCLPYSTLSRF